MSDQPTFSITTVCWDLSFFVSSQIRIVLIKEHVYIASGNILLILFSVCVWIFCRINITPVVFPRRRFCLFIKSNALRNSTLAWHTTGFNIVTKTSKPVITFGLTGWPKFIFNWVVDKGSSINARNNIKPAGVNCW